METIEKKKEKKNSRGCTIQLALITMRKLYTNFRLAFANFSIAYEIFHIVDLTLKKAGFSINFILMRGNLPSRNYKNQFILNSMDD